MPRTRTQVPESLAGELFEKLDTILRVIALQVAADKSITERARLLKAAGMDNNTIARVLNTTNATVRTLTSGGTSRTGRRLKLLTMKKPKGRRR
jgi:DNA-binding CsgD family transcriptional regulator